MIRHFGIDTSVLVRLTTKEPERDFRHCIEELQRLVEDEAGEVFASNQVVGEAYVALQFHYGISDLEARRVLADILTSGLVAPLNGHSIIQALQTPGGPGLFDRLIADDYTRVGLETLTLDRRMAKLPHVRRL